MLVIISIIELEYRVKHVRGFIFLKCVVLYRTIHSYGYTMVDQRYFDIL